MSWHEREHERELEYRAVLAVDIERSAGRGNTALFAIRDVLAAALREALEESGIAWDACLRHDLGDGLRVVAPAGAPKARLVHPLLHELAARLRAHNGRAGDATRVRVRVALHAGDVHVAGDGGVSGWPLEVLARLLDAAPARRALAEAPEALAVAAVLSRHFHDETVRHGYPGIDPEAFTAFTFTAKEHRGEAWLHVPGLPGQPVTDARPPENANGDGTGNAAGNAAAPKTAPAPAHMVNKATGHGVIYATQNGTQHIHPAGDP
ncbi:hypothetical protein [Streptomyces radicis]|uniref:Uncharacterized protein n=1 Tax=Streptomyces radicis TaxID=1750517 RepID=A0A3A9WEI0_9ACTN|nr:hypothetical protein [Streptomyces radicis]RKN11448.1 hypothetical protein D7319_05765 [Streptomyces radicis]RKN26532.1 hypothetical protein D7318_03895 [Streptomyces radicis]